MPRATVVVTPQSYRSNSCLRMAYLAYGNVPAVGNPISTHSLSSLDSYLVIERSGVVLKW